VLNRAFTPRLPQFITPVLEQKIDRFGWRYGNFLREISPEDSPLATNGDRFARLHQVGNISSPISKENCHG